MSETATQPAAKQPAFFTFEGETFTFPADTVPLEQIVGEIQAHLLAKQKKPWEVLDEAEKHVKSEAMLQRLANEAYADMKRGERPISPMEALIWLEGPSGLAWVIWRLLKDKHPKLTLETAGKLVESLGIAAAREIQKQKVA